jgi:hypothetical protein
VKITPPHDKQAKNRVDVLPVLTASALFTAKRNMIMTDGQANTHNKKKGRGKSGERALSMLQQHPPERPRLPD